MTEVNPKPMTGTLSMSVLPQANGQYVCQIASSLTGHEPDTIQCCGQTKEHAIAIALERLASQYRQMAEDQQQIAWDGVERTERRQNGSGCLGVKASVWD